ncbi:MAG: hypothetical protein ACTSPC_04875, partial [Candidatus Heimdallarchaeota archaeon]
MEKERISKHKSVIKMYDRLRSELVEEHEKIDRVYKRIEKEGITNVWDRFEDQGLAFGDPDRRCQFCLQGVRCDLCSNGP